MRIGYSGSNTPLGRWPGNFFFRKRALETVTTSYVLIGKKTYGFEADLDNQMSLSFDEDGNYKLDRDHPFLKDNYKKGKFNNSDSDKREDKDKDKDKEED